MNYSELFQALLQAPEINGTKELINVELQFDVTKEPTMQHFPSRNLNEKYAKQELLWYYRADRWDDSITEHAKMWKKLRQKDGGFNSNYGQVIFKPRYSPLYGILVEPFLWCVGCLVKNPASRQAIIPIVERDYLHSECNDQRCCMFMQFLIRNNRLDCYVVFRSNDAIWGVNNDVFTLSEIFKGVYAEITVYKPDLQIGIYHHRAISMHVYERHYEMLKKMANESPTRTTPYPMPTSRDIFALRHNLARKGEYLEWITQ